MDKMDTQPNNTTGQQNITVPVAIIVAGIIIAGAIFFSQGSFSQNGNPTDTNATGVRIVRDDKPIPAVSEQDHIRGNPNAKAILVEYSDLECPFCKRFHDTMKAVLDSYGKDGDVAWVYRHFPIESLHRKATREAQATECAAKFGGNASFWAYTDRIYEITPSNDGLDLKLLPEIAGELGFDKEAFANCIEENTGKDIIEAQKQDAIDAGGRGTPFSVIISAETLNDKQIDSLLEINNAILAQLPPGSSDPISVIDEGRQVTLGGAFPQDLVEDIIDIILEK
ncbi:MAG: hypothetical protein COV70_03305 [Parcubacteria group bacterium CG11_big_fil_rev_8_21_14_0_20_39_22]|nr:MAG: hypothetical protein COV70_03305 [Parcubacteria group bacterium CG11_big_fil_rev_8_21_14_0_20_39_22]